MLCVRYVLKKKRILNCNYQLIYMFANVYIITYYAAIPKYNRHTLCDNDKLSTNVTVQKLYVKSKKNMNHCIFSNCPERKKKNKYF
jgi:hypothetical protein